MKTPTNIHVSNVSEFSNRASAGWELGGARYHVWFDTETKQIDARTGQRGPPALYKNSLADHGTPGYFPTRYLDATKGANGEIIRQVFEEIERSGLIKGAWEKVVEAQRRQEVENAERARLGRIREAAPRLLEELRGCISREYYQGQHDTARALLRELGEAE